MKHLLHALDFAAERHRDQRRKGVEATPYINHPIRVARILVDAGIEDDIILAAAILHDTVEDTETTLDELSARFGPEVAAIVAEMTDDKTQTKAERKQCQIDRAAGISPGAKLVKLADKIANIRDIADCPPADWPIERKRDYFDWARAVVDRIRDADAGLARQFDEAFRRRP